MAKHPFITEAIILRKFLRAVTSSDHVFGLNGLCQKCGIDFKTHINRVGTDTYKCKTAKMKVKRKGSK